MSVPETVYRPIIVSGMGGSGTRLPTEILTKLGVYMGKDLNSSYDNLTFSFLFQRPQWYVDAILNRPGQISVGFSAFINGMFGTVNRGAVDQVGFINEAHHDTAHTFPQAWRDQRLQKLQEVTGPSAAAVDRWGWKLPQNDIFMDYYHQIFPGMRMVYMKRHGLDMAFTDSFENDQTKLWGPILHQIEPCPDALLPKANLDYWIGSNRQAEKVRRTIGDDRFFTLRLEDLVTNPETTIRELARFVDHDCSDEEIGELSRMIVKPSSLGRYKEQDLSMFSDEQLAAVEEYGYGV